MKLATFCLKICRDVHYCYFIAMRFINTVFIEEGFGQESFIPITMARLATV